LKIAFHHIPKTAGTTLISILDQNYDLSEILPGKYFGKPARDVEVNDIITRGENIQKYSLIRGHFPAPGFDNIAKEYFRITVLREPTRRLFSLYNDWRSKTEQSLSNAHPHDVRAARLAKEYSISDFLKHRVHPITALFDNGQVRMLADCMSQNEINEEALDKAKATLDKMQLVGITEMLDCFLNILCEYCDWTYPDHYQSLNTRKYNLEELESIDKDILFEYTKWDRRLYDYAKKLFNNKLNEHLDYLKSKQAIGVKQNTKNSISLDMTQGFKCKGFHVREGLGGKHVWRWTGPSVSSTVSIRLVPHLDYVINIDIISVIDQKIVDGLKIKFNNIDLNVKHIGIVENQQRVTAHINRDFIEEDKADELEIITPFTISHAQVQPETNDDRQKGIAITKIDIQAIKK